MYNEVFYSNEEIKTLLEELNEKYNDFEISQKNFCSFNAESMEFGVTYETFLEKFNEMSEGELKFTETGD